MDNLRNWRLEEDDQKILWCFADCEGSTTNVLSAVVLAEFESIIANVEHGSYTGLVILSAKESGFFAGADIREFTRISDVEAARDAIHRVHALFHRLQSLPCTVVCIIDGFCMGGGLELALACDFRLATNNDKTRFGFPEILLGIFPGFGGSMRSIRRLGVLKAMDLMLTGRMVRVAQARAMGLVDFVADKATTEQHARSLIREKRAAGRSPLWFKLLQLAPVRRVVGSVLRRQVRKRAHPEHYPAPYSLIELWERAGGDETAMLAGEAERVAQLLNTETSRNLVRLYFLRERLKNLAVGAGDAEFQRVHVVGAGVMGGDIAAWCALHGLAVTLQDREQRYVDPALHRAERLFRKKLKKPEKIAAARQRLQSDLAGSGITAADVIIEAVIEDAGIKRALFNQVEVDAKATAILATNTSSIELATLNRDLHEPERLVGIHFFNPVAKMQLVEIVREAATSDIWVSRAAAFIHRIDRLPLPVKSSPGFLVNRILTPYLLEASLLLQEGMPAEVVDEVAEAYGMPMGPIELADTVGLDICVSVARHLADKLNIEIPPTLAELLNSGRLGRKSGRGFYEYTDGKIKKRHFALEEYPSKKIEDRLVFRILNECAACLAEDIVEDADLLDAGMVFGTGFAPFRGGPMHYAKRIGYQIVCERLRELEHEFGDRFRPSSYWSSASVQ